MVGICEHPSDVRADRQAGILAVLDNECIKKVASLASRLFRHDMEEYGFCKRCVKAIEKEIKDF